MVLCTLGIRTESGGALRRIMVLSVTTCFTKVVAYIPAATAAAMGTPCGASRLLKHIPVYGYYGYWRIKEKENNAAKHENLILEEFGEFGLQTAFFGDAF